MIQYDKEKTEWIHSVSLKAFKGYSKAGKQSEAGFAFQEQVTEYLSQFFTILEVNEKGYPDIKCIINGKKIGLECKSNVYQTCCPKTKIPPKTDAFILKKWCGDFTSQITGLPVFGWLDKYRRFWQPTPLWKRLKEWKLSSSIDPYKLGNSKVLE